MRQYGRDDVDYSTFYSPWMRQLALRLPRAELEKRLHGTAGVARMAGDSHRRAIEATGSMQGQSSRRAHARNVVAACGDLAIALRGAIEIYELFPEHTHEAAKATSEGQK